jgi:hypothetical protein
MLTKGDDFPLHQTPEPIAYAGTDRNFYDRYFFNGYAPDGSDFFAVAFGVYPHLNVADAHFSYIRDGVEYCLHASRELQMERFDLTVGPISIEVVEPLQRLTVRVNGEGIAAELHFTGRAFPIEEPRFVHRIGPRTYMDYTRLTQNGHYAGWVEIDGRRITLAPGTCGTRDRSWGVRPVGAADAQPHAAGTVQSFFWQWTPINLPSRSVFFHINANRDGSPWNTRAAIAPDGGGHHDVFETPSARLEAPLLAGTRWPERGTLTIAAPDGPLTLTIEPLVRFQMRGLGYVTPRWNHGLYHGPLVVEREDLVLDALDPMSPTMENFHVQIVSRVTTSAGEVGTGVFEQLIIGPYDPMGLKEYFDYG